MITPPALPLSSRMFLSDPSDVRPDASTCDNHVMLKPYYALSYNSGPGEPNWVAWRVIASDLGTAPRKRTFDHDTTLPAGFTQVQMHDYIGGGFDRGHICPHPTGPALSKCLTRRS